MALVLYEGGTTAELTDTEAKALVGARLITVCNQPHAGFEGDTIFHHSPGVTNVDIIQAKARINQNAQEAVDTEPAE